MSENNVITNEELEAIEPIDAPVAIENLETAAFLPEAPADFDLNQEVLATTESVEGTELEDFESANIEEVEFVEDERIDSIIESILFASDRPVSLASIKLVFKGTNVRGEKIKRALDRFAVELAGANRGVCLEEVTGGYQLRTKIDNMHFITRTLKARPFRLSGPALETLAIVAYKQPIIKSEIDEIRGVESGHLLRALMEKNLVTFEGKSDLPGKPMQYGTTRKFLEIFGLRNLKELPTLSQIDELLPEGITDEEEKKTTLSQLTDALSEQVIGAYSQGEEDLIKITDELAVISTSSDFFEQEKLKQKQKRETERAQSIREAILVGESVSNRDRNWLQRFDEAQLAGEKFVDQEAVVEVPGISAEENLVSRADDELSEEQLVAEEKTNTLDEDEQLFTEEGLEANDIADID